ncbi:MAG: ABC transporter permease [Elusimicrobia bacterium RIFCSPLOWO2_12_FULL_59_9]|nr:MAG: ABC transporter permease [Elusimicrobia bacterium RIFCSPLOWO2_12_FULL_59_9]
MTQALVNGLTLGAVYALVALGYSMVYGILGMINFAHGEIYMLGAFHGILALAFAQHYLANFSPVVCLLGALVLAMLFCGGYGFTLERIAYRPLRHAPVLSPLISAIGMSFLLQNYVMVAQGSGIRGFPMEFGRRLTETRFSAFAGAEFSLLEVFILATSLLCMAGLHLYIYRSKMGKAMRATSQDRRMASLLGVDVDRVISATFIAGSALAAVAGVMVSMYVHAVKFNDGYIMGMKAFTAAVLGGIGNIPGAMLGGVLLGVVENIGIWFLGAGYKDAYSFIVLLLVLIVLPRGILGEQVSDKV